MAILLVNTFKSERQRWEELLAASGIYGVISCGTHHEALRQDFSGSFIHMVIFDLSSGDDAIAAANHLWQKIARHDVPFLLTNNNPELSLAALKFVPELTLSWEGAQHGLVPMVRLALSLAHERDRVKARQWELQEVQRQLSLLRLTMQNQGSLDPETLLPDTSACEVVLEKEWKRARRVGKSLAVVALSLDSSHTKEFDETQKRWITNQAVQNWQRHLKRPADLLTRWDQNHFVAILPETDANEAAVVAENIRQTVVTFFGESFSTSCGIASFLPQSGEDDVRELVRAALGALVAAQQKGTSQIKIALAPAKKPAKPRSA